MLFSLFSSTKRNLVTLAGCALFLVPALQAAQIIITGVQAGPNERTIGNNPPEAIDGEIGTYTWSTEYGNVASPSWLAVDFGSLADLNRIRLYKDQDGGGGSAVNIKDLVIEYTDSSELLPLSARTWLPVSGLTNGYLGAELMNAAAVNSNGTVTGDVHDSVTTGNWASLSFDLVDATGVRVSFSPPPANAGTNNHYRVYEFQAYDDPIVLSPVPEPGAFVLLAGLLPAAWYARCRALRQL